MWSVNHAVLTNELMPSLSLWYVGTSLPHMTANLASAPLVELSVVLSLVFDPLLVVREQASI